MQGDESQPKLGDQFMAIHYVMQTDRIIQHKCWRAMTVYDEH